MNTLHNNNEEKYKHVISIVYDALVINFIVCSLKRYHSLIEMINSKETKFTFIFVKQHK